MNNNEVINLYYGISEFKNNSLDKDVLYPFIKLRMLMKDRVEEFEKVKKEFTEQTKPKNFKEGDDVKEWNKLYEPLILKWLDEPFAYERVFTFEQAIDYGVSNDAVGSLQDAIVKYLVVK